MMHESSIVVLLECPDLSVRLLHVAHVLVYDLVESAVLDRSYDVVITCHVDGGRLVDVVPFKFRRRRRMCCI